MPKPCLPKNVAEILVQNEAIVNVESPSLRLCKYVCVRKSDKELPPRPNKAEDKDGYKAWQKLKVKKGGLKKDELTAVSKVCGKHSKLPPRANYALRISDPAARAFVLKTGARLMINMAKGFYENANINLHRNFGYTEIPGSAVKGCAAHAAREVLSEESDDSKKAEIAKKFIRVFGYPTNDKQLDASLERALPEEKLKDSAGKIAFMSAIPWQKIPNIEVDVLTPHHSQYYEGKKNKATDDEAPVPSFFLAAAAQSEFLFSLRAVNHGTEDDLNFAETVLKKALTENGIGAKTVAGYGWFESACITPKMEDVK